MSDSGDQFKWGVFCLVAGGWGFFNGLSALKRKRLIENIPTSKIRGIAMGLVEVHGKAVSEVLIKSPFTQTNCVMCKYTIEEYIHQGRSSRWVVVEQGFDYAPFQIQDDSGKILIHPFGAELDIPGKVVHKGKNPTAKIQKHLEKEFNETKKGKDVADLYKGYKKGKKTVEHIFGRNLRYTEYIVTKGQELYVLGTAGKNPFIKTAVKNEEGAMIQADDKNPYFISTKHETDVLKSLKWSVAGVYWGIPLFVFGLWLLLNLVGL